MGGSRSWARERLDEIDQLCAIEGTLVWVSARSPDADTIEILRREFNLHPLVVEDVQKRGQRPKLDAYEDQHVIVAYEVTEAEPGCPRSTSSSAPAGW